MTLETGWIAVALSSSIENGTSTGAKVGGREIVVWRDNAGGAHVWEDRCPHRGMRLSFGFVRGDHIACLYHGWQYDSSGQCRHIPAHPSLDVPATIAVPTYRAAEKYGMVWATASDTAQLPEIEAASGVSPVRSLYIDGGADDVLAALGQAGLTPLDAQAGVLTINGDRLLIALQAVSPERTALHIVVLEPASAGFSRRGHAQWAETFRYTIENSQPTQAEVA